jgi:hypothetical protein
MTAGDDSSGAFETPTASSQPPQPQSHSSCCPLSWAQDWDQASGGRARGCLRHSVFSWYGQATPSDGLTLAARALEMLARQGAGGAPTMYLRGVKILNLPWMTRGNSSLGVGGLPRARALTRWRHARRLGVHDFESLVRRPARQPVYRSVSHACSATLTGRPSHTSAYRRTGRRLYLDRYLDASR